MASSPVWAWAAGCLWVEAPDLVCAQFREPQRPVRAGGDRKGTRVRAGYRKLAEDAARRDPADLVAAALGEPDVAIWASDDPFRTAIDGRDGEFGHRARQGD